MDIPTDDDLRRLAYNDVMLYTAINIARRDGLDMNAAVRLAVVALSERCKKLEELLVQEISRRPPCKRHP